MSAEMLTALRKLREGVEAQAKTDGYDPRNVMDAHTWLALAMRNADAIIARADGAKIIDFPVSEADLESAGCGAIK